MRFLIAAGTTRTAAIEGISAAGTALDLLTHTPSADAEIVAYGRPVRTPATPVSPTGCPTPALVTRAVRDLVGFEAAVLDAGLAAPTAAPTVDIGADPGEDVRDPDPVPDAGTILDAAREFGRGLPDDHVILGETIPGGTTTALGVLTALGEPHDVSSSLPENPLALKREVVAEGLAAGGLAEGDAAGDSETALRRAGDPVLAAVAGLAMGALEEGSVTLAGGTQMVAAAALIRHAGVDAPLELATTSYVAADADLDAAADDFDLDLTVTDPGFDGSDHAGLAGYTRGEAKEGVGMGGALALAERAGIPMTDVRARTVERYEALVGDDGT